MTVAPTKAVLVMILSFLSVIIITSFYFNNYIPIWVSSTSILLSLFSTHYLYKKKYINVLCYIVFVVFALPFIHIPSYMFFDFGTKPKWLWGIYVNPYMIDENIIKLTAMLGALGCAGIVLSYFYRSNKIIAQEKNILYTQNPKFKTLPMASFFIFLFLGLFFAEISSTTQSVFDAAYAFGMTNSLSGISFDSAWMFGFIIILFTFCDAWLDRSPTKGKIKRFLAIILIFYLVIFLQLLKGDREALALVAAILVTPLFCSRIFNDINNYKVSPLVILIGVLFILLINLTIGIMRMSMIGLDTISEGIDVLLYFFTEDDCPHRSCYGFNDLFSGTWSAVLLTPISIAGDYIYNTYIYEYKGLKWGEDYWNIFLSIPPGFLANWLDYVRPISSMSGPAWEMRYGGGGYHAIVLPFRNFSIIGVFLIPFFYGLIVRKVEYWTIKKISVTRLSLILTLIMCSPIWLWYGEKALINAIIIWFVMSCIFKFFCSINFIFRDYKWKSY